MMDTQPDDVTAVTDYLMTLVCSLADPKRTREPIAAVPPIELEFALNGGRNTSAARHYANLVVEGRPLAHDARILDVGCGYGRIALELATRLTDAQSYLGLDPNAPSIAWAQQHIASQRPGFAFERIDVTSGPYNRDGSIAGAHFRFPVPDDSVDVVFLVSVFTHVDLATVERYMHEAARVLKPATGRLVATFFLLDDEVQSLVAAGRAAYKLPHVLGSSRVENADEPELVIAHPLADVLAIAAAAGFASTSVRPGFWSGRSNTSGLDYQDLLIADLTPLLDAPADAPAGPPIVVDVDSLHAVAQQLAAAGVRTRADAAAAIVVALSVAVHAVWWADAGWTLGTRALDAVRVPSVRLRALGIHDPAPSGAPSGAVDVLSEQDVIDRVVRACAPAAALVALIHEVLAVQAMLVDAAAASGGLVLRQQGRADVPVSLPSR
jgi:SAM-dependent methyltransferase